jgi:hypothetical protein
MFDPRDDARDVFLHDLDLPLERDREYVLDRDHVYELNGDDARTLARQRRAPGPL